MLPQYSAGVFNQVRWPGAGDVDDCAVISDLMGVHAAGPWLRLVNVTDYRAAAGLPDAAGPTPFSIAGSAKALRALYRELAIEVLEDATWSAYLAKVKAGHPASTSVLSSKLPQSYGFAGNHRVLIVWNGSAILVLNPLAPAHSRATVITEAQLQAAIAAHVLAGVNAIVFPTQDAAFESHPLYAAAIRQGRVLEHLRQEKGAKVTLLPLEG